MTKIKKLLLVYMLAQLVLGYTVAYAQTYKGVEEQISKYLCTPNTVPESQSSNTNGALLGGDPTGQNNFQNNAALNNNNNGVLYQCINQIYKFSIVVASVVAVFFIVIAGYIYMSSDGDQEAVSRAKSILTSSIASIVILLIGYVFLRALNPDIVEFHSVQPPSVVIPNQQQTNNIGGTCTASTTFSCNDPGTATTCAQYSSYIQQYAGRISNSNVNGAALLSAIMYHESRCQTDKASSASAYGLMQMKIGTANTFKSKCGITETIDSNWFKNNPGPSICLAAEYLNYLSPQCGKDAGMLLSGYAMGNCSTASLCPTAVSEMLACYGGGGRTTTTGGGAASTQSTQAAQKVLNLATSNKIFLATTHVSGNVDSANAMQNIKDVASGQLAKNSCYTDNKITAPCKNVDLNVSMLNALADAGNQMLITVTEIAGGVHSSNMQDTHYLGRAVDVRPTNANGTTQAQLAAIFRKNGASQIGLECVGGPNKGFLVLTGTNDDNTACIGKAGYHLHVQW